jgi:hypothetical protein
MKTLICSALYIARATTSIFVRTKMFKICYQRQLRDAATRGLWCIVTALFAAGFTNYSYAELVCGMDVYPSPIGFPAAVTPPDPQPNPSGDPCVDGETVFGPERFDRASGRPEMEMADFTLDADADVCIVSTAGDLQGDSMGKAFLSVDGMSIAEPEDYDDGTVEQTMSLVSGSHGLGVRAVGKPGGYVDVEVRRLASGSGDGGPGLPSPGEVIIDPETGALDMVNADGSVRLQNVATDHPLLTPNGDGHHDTTVFQALTTPLNDLPGLDQGTTAYYLDWAFQIVNLDSCSSIDPGLSGMEQIHSPTMVETTWDGTDATGALLPPGNYGYSFDVTIVDEFGAQFGRISSPELGIVIDPSPTDYLESADYLGNCNSSTDPSACRCPGVDGFPGTPDPNCEFTWLVDLLPEIGSPLSTVGNYRDPSVIDKSFITTNYDPATGRYTVIVDLTNYNAGGLVPKHRGVWPDEDSLRQWVADMTGVPKSTGDSLFNFDYIQLGTSTAVDQNGVRYSLNNFLVDAMTDDAGTLRVGGANTPLSVYFNNDVSPPPQFALTAPRAGDECTYAGNTNGVDSARAKFCAYNTAVRVGDTTDLGIYSLRTTLFDIEYNGARSKQDQICTITTFFQCGVRTFKVAADTLEIDSSFYVDNGGNPAFTRSETTQLNDATGVSFSADRGDGEGGVCSRAVATRGGLAIRMDAADGAVPDSCVINGIF